ncbi:MAG: YceI family protein [Pseudomonadota bacterium]
MYCEATCQGKIMHRGTSFRWLLFALTMNIGWIGAAAAGGFCEPFRQVKVPQYVLNTMIDAATIGHLYRFQSETSRVKFSIDSSFKLVEGNFRKIEGGIAMESGAEHRGQALIAIKTGSVSTSNSLVENIIKSDTFLDVDEYPQILFTSTGFKWLGDTSGFLKGNLTLHGVTKPVSFHVKLSDLQGNRVGKSNAALARITTSINRNDFGMNKLPFAVNDKVNLSIRVQAAKSKLDCLQCHG